MEGKIGGLNTLAEPRVAVPRIVSAGVCLLLLKALLSAARGDPLPQNTVNNIPAEETGPHRLNEQTRVIATINVPLPAATNTVERKKSFHWKSSWAEWNGFHMELSQKTPIDDPFAGVRAKLQDRHP